MDTCSTSQIQDHDQTKLVLIVIGSMDPAREVLADLFVGIDIYVFGRIVDWILEV